MNARIINLFERSLACAASSVDRAIRAFARGGAVIVADRTDREDEADIIISAELCTIPQLATLIRHTSGILCCPMPATTARRLHLDPMVRDNTAPHGTAFTISVDCRHGLTTGISARDRWATARALARQDALPEDFVRPGHMFPLIAHDQGVLGRPGHTEAAVDLARLAGRCPVGLIGELMNDDGTVMKGNDVRGFALAHAMPLISVEELIAFRSTIGNYALSA